MNFTVLDTTSGGNNFNHFHENQLTKFSARDEEKIQDFPGVGQWRCQEFSVGGLKPGHMASTRSVSLYRSLGAEPPVGSRGRAPGGG